jgi:hypothetical protein
MRPPPLRLLLLAAPPIFVGHFLEESPGFVAWFNAHVARGITTPLFWSVNYTALAITIVVVLVDWLGASAPTAYVAIAWFGCLMFANALFHIAGALADGAYMPGLVTAVLLYLPYFGLVVGRAVEERRLRAGAVAAATLLGALPMLAHGYLIVFRGDRLF